MASSGQKSITRTHEHDAGFTRLTWLDRAGLGLSSAGVMLLGVFFVLSAVIAGWVADLHGAEAGNVSLLGRVSTYEAWLFPASTAAVAMVKIGVGVVLYGIVLRLWTRVAGVRESLPVLIEAGAASRLQGGSR